jgi:predicted HTH domain antitoxin
MSVTLEISDNFGQQLLTNPEAAEARLHLKAAMALHGQGELPVGRAAAFASLSQVDFEKIVRERQVPMPYSLTDFEHDAAYARSRR